MTDQKNTPENTIAECLQEMWRVYERLEDAAIAAHQSGAIPRDTDTLEATLTLNAAIRRAEKILTPEKPEEG